MLDSGSNKQEEAAGVDQEKQCYMQPKLTTSDSVQQENRKQKGEGMERGVLPGDEKKKGIILALYSWTITEMFNHTSFFWQKTSYLPLHCFSCPFTM